MRSRQIFYLRYFYRYFSTRMIVFDGIFHKIINSTVEKKIASGNGAVTLFLDQFHFFLVSNGGKIAADFIGEFCQ